jgi:hypothetical protein
MECPMKAKSLILTAALALAAATGLAAATNASTCCDNQADPSPPTQAPTAAHKIVSPKRVSFYQVPLECPAAPQIGCGSASKPLLLEMENSPMVSEAWLNRAGTVMAVVWSKHTTAEQHSAILKAALESQDITAKELTGTSRRKPLKDFQAGSGWYRGADVDRLSEEEAGIIAARWVGRIREKIPVTDEKAQALQQGFTGAVKRKLTGGATRIETQEEMLKICRQHLDQSDVAILLDAFKTELSPGSGQ